MNHADRIRKYTLDVGYEIRAEIRARELGDDGLKCIRVAFCSIIRIDQRCQLCCYFGRCHGSDMFVLICLKALMRLTVACGTRR